MLWLEEIEKKRKDLMYQCERKKYIRDRIPNIGEIIEDDNSITCIVKQDLLDRNMPANFYDLQLFGMRNPYEQTKVRINYYKLDKPVYYIFDGIIFDAPIKIASYYCDVKFVNCMFSHSNITVFNADKITFAGNEFCDGTSTTYEGAFLRTGPNSKIGELNFKNENFINKYQLEDYGEINFGIDIAADKVNIINSNIITNEKNGQTRIRAKKIEIAKSLIESPKINFDVFKVSVDRRSKLKASKEVIIGNNACNCDVDICEADIYSPYVVWNGIEMVNYKIGNTAFFHDDPNDLKKKRKEVVQLLKNIKNKYNDNI